jgi:nucleotide-binding universal stress UspA family protein
MPATAGKIVAGVDGSQSSVAALRWAVRQAELTGGSVHAVIAWQFPLTTSGFSWVPTPAFDDVDYAGLAAKALGAVVEQVSSTVTVSQQVMEGDASQVLLDASADAELLVVGNRGHGAFADALLGSVSERCVRHSHCPVVVVHAPA